MNFVLAAQPIFKLRSQEGSRCRVAPSLGSGLYGGYIIGKPSGCFWCVWPMATGLKIKWVFHYSCHQLV